RGVSEDRIAVGAPASLPHLWSRRLLRQLPEPPRDQTLPEDRAPDHRRLRSAGGVGLVLPRRGDARPRRENGAPKGGQPPPPLKPPHAETARVRAHRFRQTPPTRTKSRSDPDWRSLIRGAYSGSLYQALAWAIDGNSSTTIELGSAPCPSRRSATPRTRYRPPCLATSAAVLGPYSATHDGSRICSWPIAYAGMCRSCSIRAYQSAGPL